MNHFRCAAESGNTDSQLTLARILYQSQNNLPLAAKYYKLAAEQGDIEAQFDLAVMNYEGDGIPVNMTEAARFFALAANSPTITPARLLSPPSRELAIAASARYFLGMMFYLGKLEERDYHEAMKHFKLAAGLGHGPSLDTLGIMYYEGLATKRDKREAASYFQRAARKGVANSQFCLAAMLLDGDGVTADFAEGWKYLSAAVKNGYGPAYFKLAELYSRGRPGIMRKNPVEAAKFYEMAANAGSEEGMKKIGYLYWEGEIVPKNWAKAVKNFKMMWDNWYTGGEELKQLLKVSLTQEKTAAT